jgi:hypothetical protein
VSNDYRLYVNMPFLLCFGLDVEFLMILSTLLKDDQG